MAVPAAMRALRSYQLNDAATQLSGILKFTRFEAIRRNKSITCVNSQAAPLGQASIWSDNDADGAPGPTEKQILLTVNATLVADGTAPNGGALAAAIGVATLTAINPSGDSVKFDQRGAVVAVPSATYVYYIGNTSDLGGYRAVVVLPSGSVQTWTYSGGTGP